MLDPLPISEEVVPLQCESCGLLYDEEQELKAIEEHGTCVDCTERING